MLQESLTVKDNFGYLLFCLGLRAVEDEAASDPEPEAEA